MAETLAQKLAAIQRTLEPVEKTGQMTGGKFSYKFLRAEQLFAIFQPKLAKAGIVVLPEIVSAEAKPGNPEVTIYHMLFTVTNADDRSDTMEARWIAEASSRDDKGANKAATAGLKTFIAKLFLVSDEKDPEAQEAEELYRRTQEILASVQKANATFAQRDPSPDEEKRLNQLLRAALTLAPNFEVDRNAGLLNNLRNVEVYLKG